MSDTEDTAPTPTPTPAPATSGPTVFTAGMRGFNVLDATSGEVIMQVISADADAGTVTRFDVQDGNLVLVDDAFSVITEERSIHIVAIEAAA